MSQTVAYFLTWTTYGTWLPGDARGWVQHGEGSADRAYRQRDPHLEALARRRMPKEPVLLNARFRRVVEQAVRDTCRVKHWTLHVLNVRSNHVHVVLTVPDRPPERIMASLKAWASRRLNEAADRNERRQWWTRHGSTRYLKSRASLERAVEYVRNQQRTTAACLRARLAYKRPSRARLAASAKLAANASERSFLPLERPRGDQIQPPDRHVAQ